MYGPEPGGWNPVHTPMKALKNIHRCLCNLNRVLFGWPSAFVFLPLVVLNPRDRRKTWDYIWLLSFCLLIAGYAFYWFPADGLLGPRYYFEAIPALVYLTVRGVTGVSRRLTGRLRFLPWCIVAASTVFFPLDLLPEASEVGFRGVYRAVRNQSSANYAVGGKNRALVFITGDTTTFSSGFLANDIELKAPVIYARDMGPERNRRVLSSHPGRTPYLFQSGRIAQRLIPLNENCKMIQKNLQKFRMETGGIDGFTDCRLQRWRKSGSASSLITCLEPGLRVKGIMSENMYPGSAANINYVDVPFSDMEVFADFKILGGQDYSVTLALGNGRFLDLFLNLNAAMLSFIHSSKPLYLFKWKGLGKKWSQKTAPAWGDEDSYAHRLRLVIES